MAISSLCHRTVWMICALVLSVQCLSCAYAEGGSAQATMSLIVLPNENNMAIPNEPSHGAAPRYIPDTQVSLMQYSPNHLPYRIWMSI